MGRFGLLIFFSAVLALAGCSGSNNMTYTGTPSVDILKGSGDSLQVNAPYSVSTDPAIPGSPGSILSALPNRVGSTAASNCNGIDYLSGITHNIQAQDQAVEFNPDWGPEPDSPKSAAYAVYQLGIPDGSELLRLELEWVEMTDPADDVWIGISDWSGNCWDWLASDCKSNIPFNNDAAGEYLDTASNDALIAIVVLGTAPCRLQGLHLRFGREHIWPMFGKNRFHTKQSPYLSAQTNTIKWTFSDGSGVSSSPAIAADGTIYFGTRKGNLHALSQSGQLQWSYNAGPSLHSSPAIAPDGTIYVGSFDSGKLIALNADGSLQWELVIDRGILSSPTIGPDGTIYVGGYISCSLYSIDPAGSINWAFETSARIFSSPAIGPDGTIYIGSEDRQLYAINPDGTCEWVVLTFGEVRASPSVGPDGTIYVGDFYGDFHAINPDGSTKWVLHTGSQIQSSASFDDQGNIYFGNYDGRMYALAPDGTPMWSFPADYGIVGSPAIDRNGNVYFGSEDRSVYALNSDGTLKWSYATSARVISSPAIGADGTLYIGSDDHNLYAFGPGPGD